MRPGVSSGCIVVSRVADLISDKVVLVNGIVGRVWPEPDPKIIAQRDIVVPYGIVSCLTEPYTDIIVNDAVFLNYIIGGIEDDNAVPF